MRFMDISIFKLLSALLILAITLLSAIYPFFKKYKVRKSLDFARGESLAVGIFLGAGLIHMLGDSAKEFYSLNYQYPLAFLLAGSTFLLLLLLEHIAKELYQHKGGYSQAFALLSVLMLSIHSFLEGAALGLSTSTSIFVVILFAILAHKWAASFALAVQINKTPLRFRTGLVIYLLFALMTPLGILTGVEVRQSLHQYQLLAPLFTALAGGTFLYLGSLHGLEKSVLVKTCCNLKIFMYVIFGFSLMAVLALWT